MSKFITISEAANYLGVTTTTLRRWEKEGKLIPITRTFGGQRRYELAQFDITQKSIESKTSPKTIAYARVSSRDQKRDLVRQEEVLQAYCVAQGWPYELVSDLGSGMNYQKKGLKKLIKDILEGSVGRLVITHKDRLLRFGAELIFSICAAKEVEVIIINKGQETRFEEDLAKDVLEIITVFSARLYGSRSHKNQKLLEEMKKAVDAVS